MGPFEQRLYGVDEAGDEPGVVLAGEGSEEGCTGAYTSSEDEGMWGRWGPSYVVCVPAFLVAHAWGTKTGSEFHKRRTKTFMKLVVYAELL